MKPSADELLAWILGDYYGAARMVHRRTKRAIADCVLALVDAGGAA